MDNEINRIEINGIDNIKRLKTIVDAGGDIVFFGGAGVSTESGIPDFRSASGLYLLPSNGTKEDALAGCRPEELLHIHCLSDNPDLFFKYYFAHMLHPEARPNAAHTALARLEQCGRLKAVVTQNIDGLHQAAGSENVIELHGSVHRNHCLGCGRVYTLAEIWDARPTPPRCADCGAMVRPDVVLYGEMLPEAAMDTAVRYISQADILIVGGTSLSVYPAAGLIRHFNKTRLVLINRDETPYDKAAELVIRDQIGEILGQISG